MRTSPPRTWYSAAAYLAIVVAILASRPGYAFNEDGRMRPFGVGPDKTVFSFGTLTGAAAIVSSSVFAVGDLIGAQ